jgi:hypothetical protein
MQKTSQKIDAKTADFLAKDFYSQNFTTKQVFTKCQ